MSQQNFQSSLKTLLGELSRSNRGYSVIAESLQESISADIPPIVLPDSVISLMEMGVIESKIAYTQEDLLAILSKNADILLAIKSATELEEGQDLTLSDYIAHYNAEVVLKTNKELLEFDMKDSFAALGSDAERYALAMVLNDTATDRKIVNQPYLWRTILNNRGKM